MAKSASKSYITKTLSVGSLCVAWSATTFEAARGVGAVMLAVVLACAALINI